MVLSAGLGTRIRAKFPDIPKPLVPVAGQPLIDHTLSMLKEGGVSEFVVNVHHFADQIETHLERRIGGDVAISDERDQLLETGGGILKALPLLGEGAFYSVNTDAILRGGTRNPAVTLRDRWSDEVDALLLLVPVDNASGYRGEGDFALTADGRILPKSEGEALIFTGLQLLRPSLFGGAPIEKVSTRKFWKIAEERGRFRGVLFDGAWMHVGDPVGHHEAERRLKAGG
jgi:MurNAc alpha-1-phosphate uridylyltransferase